MIVCTPAWAALSLALVVFIAGDGDEAQFSYPTQVDPLPQVGFYATQGTEN